MEKRVGIIQSAYLPWRGYFDFIASVDLFVVLDDVKYPQGRSWRNRNRLKTRHGLSWITVPVASGASQKAIDEVEIVSGDPSWRERHKNLMTSALGPAAHFKDAIKIWEEAMEADDVKLSALNVRLLKSVCDYLEIETPLVMSRQICAEGRKTEKLINILKGVGATRYLSGPAAREYMDVEAFKASGIALEYKSYDYPAYPQLWGDFVGTVSVLDLIANVGKNARDCLSSLRPNVVAVEARGDLTSAQ